MRTLRPKNEVDAGVPEAEVAEFEMAGQKNMHKGSWISLFNRQNHRRTGVRDLLGILCMQLLTSSC